MSSSTPPPAAHGDDHPLVDDAQVEAGPSSDASAGEPNAPSVGAPRARRGMRGNWRGLLLSMLATAAVVFVLYAIVPRPQAVVQPPVDVTPVAKQIKEDTGERVWIPSLDPVWRATSVRREQGAGVAGAWYAGYHRSDDDTVFVAVQQIPAETPAKEKGAWIADAVSGGSADGTTTVAGRSWAKYTNGADPTRRGLVGEVGGLTTVVSGLADYATLEHVVGSLRPYGG